MQSKFTKGKSTIVNFTGGEIQHVILYYAIMISKFKKNIENLQETQNWREFLKSN